MLNSRRFIVTVSADSDSRGLYHLKTHLEEVLRKLSQSKYNLNDVRTYVSEFTKIEGLALDLASELGEQARNFAENAADNAIEGHDSNRHF